MGRSLLIDAIGTVIEVDGSNLTEDSWAAVVQAWSGAAVGGEDATSPSATVKAHGTVPTSSMLASLSIEVTLAALAQRAGEALLLHAAGVATPEGRVVVLVGPSGRGKTTASRILGREFGYVSDETVAIEADGTVLPYRKPLSIIEDTVHLKAQRSPEDLGLIRLSDVPLRMAALVLLERDAAAGAPRVERVDRAEGLVGLAEQASYLGRLRHPLATLLSHMTAAGGVHRVVYREAETLVPVIAQLADRGQNLDQTWNASEAGDIPAGPAIPAPTSSVGGALEGRYRTTGGTYRRAPVIDVHPLDEARLAVLIQHSERSTRILVLDGIAPVIWEATEHPATIGALVAATTARHGQPPDADAATLVSASVEEMVREGILVGEA